jgi:hypothetical protein
MVGEAVNKLVEDNHLKAMLFDAIETVEELQVLIWFEARDANVSADAEFVAAQTKLSVERVQEALEGLFARGFLLASATAPRRFLYSSDPVVRDALDQITDAYRADPRHVTRLLTENAAERVRSFAT